MAKRPKVQGLLLSKQLYHLYFSGIRFDSTAATDSHIGRQLNKYTIKSDNTHGVNALKFRQPLKSGHAINLHNLV